MRREKNMSYFRCSRNGVVLAALIGMALLAAYPVWAQNQPAPKPDPKGTPEQALQYLGATARGEPLPVLLSTVDSDGSANLVIDTQLHDPVDEMLGATLQPVSDTLRAQLSIPAGQGLLVASLRGDGPSAHAGLKQNDILLTLAGKPLATVDDLLKQLRAAGEAAVPLKALRAGKPIMIQVRPVYRVTIGPVAEQKAEYYIGVSIDAPDDAVRAQLALPAGRGVVVSEVVHESPAEKAGVQKHDIVLELGSKLIDSPETLARQVQAAKDQPTTLKLLRAGKPVTIPITGALRKVEASPSLDAYYRVLMLNQAAETAAYRSTLAGKLSGLNLADRREKLAARAGGEDLRQRLEQVEQELKALRAAVDKVNETLKAVKAKKQD
jgi:membrane-associated protease RseP (regulator of RpoE activity)